MEDLALIGVVVPVGELRIGQDLPTLFPSLVVLLPRIGAHEFLRREWGQGAHSLLDFIPLSRQTGEPLAALGGLSTGRGWGQTSHIDAIPHRQ
jgi:hypothetical protein